MQLRQIAAAATLLPAVSATGLLEKPTRGWCGTAATPEFLDSVARVQEAEEAEAKAAAKRDPSLPLRPRQAIVIPTYMHAVVNSSVGAGVLGEAALQDQLDVMNERFSPHGVEFRLGAAVTRLVDDELAGGPYGDGVPRRKLYDYWQTTRQGGYDTLNLFFYTNFPWDVFGACTLPEADLPEDSWWEDGCHIASGTLPDGEITDYNLGLTAVHEIGHWLGLLHTFEGYTCSGSGDLIDDTPTESEATEGCPTGKDSCPNHPGADPVNNYMDYSTDLCFTEFTAGQETRMRNSWTELREGRSA